MISVSIYDIWYTVLDGELYIMFSLCLVEMDIYLYLLLFVISC